MNRFPEAHIIGEESAAEAFDAIPEPAGAVGLVGPKLGVNGGRCWVLKNPIFGFGSERLIEFITELVDQFGAAGGSREMAALLVHIQLGKERVDEIGNIA